MKFIYPEFLFALFALAIPIIIHLFTFRKYKRILFSSIQFLKEVKEETQSHSKLKHLLILLSRLFALSFLVFAFAQPYIPLEEKNKGGAKKGISVFLDNSFSMDGVNADGRMFDLARQAAFESAKAYNTLDAFQLLTHDFEGKHQRTVNREIFNEWVEEVKVKPSSKKLSEIFSRQQDALKDIDTQDREYIILSDFQKSMMDIENLHFDSTHKVRLVPILPEVTNNLYIDSAWFENPIRSINKADNLMARIVNTADVDLVDVSIKLSINNQQKALSSFSIKGNESVDVVLSFTLTENGSKQALLSITDYPVTYDDDYFLHFEVGAQIKVLHIYDEIENPAISVLFANDEAFNYQASPFSKLDYSLLALQDFVIVSELKILSSGISSELQKFINDGGSCLLIPAKNSDLQSYNLFLNAIANINLENTDTTSTRVNKINASHPLYTNVFEKLPEFIDLPQVLKHYVINTSTRSNNDDLMSMLNGKSFLTQATVNSGKIYISACPFDVNWTNFTRHAVYVPTLYQMALLSKNAMPLSYTIGDDNGVMLNAMELSGDASFHISDENGETDIIPEMRKQQNSIQLLFHDQLTKAGIYNVKYNDSLLTKIALNYKRSESDLRSYTADELQQIINERHWPFVSVVEGSIANLSKSLQDLDKGIKLWRWCILLVLLFLGIEVLLSKILK